MKSDEQIIEEYKRLWKKGAIPKEVYLKIKRRLTDSDKNRDSDN